MEPVEAGLRVQVVFPPDLGAILRAMAEAEHRPVRFQVERLVIEALKARNADPALSDKEPVNAR